MGPAEGRVGLHALDEIVSKVVVRIIRNDGPKGVHGPGQDVTRRFALGVALEAAAFRVWGVLSNARELQRSAVDEGRDAIGPGHEERLGGGEGVNIVPGQEALLIGPFPLNPAPAQHPAFFRERLRPGPDGPHRLL